MSSDTDRQEFLPASSVAIESPPPAHVRELTAREALFAQWFAESRSLVTAYKQSHTTNANSSYGSLWGAALTVLERPHVTKRVEEIQERLAANGVIRALEILQDLADQVNTDTNEIIRHEVRNCRNCNGVDFKAQWTDGAEFARALDAYNAQQARGAVPKGEPRLMQPDPSGGFGFDYLGSVNPTCPHCMGAGKSAVFLADTTKLSPQARKLIKSIKQDRYGVVSIEMYDKNQARDMILKMLGAYKNDGKGLNLTGVAPLDGISVQDQSDPRATADAYLRMLSAPGAKA